MVLNRSTGPLEADRARVAQTCRGGVRYPLRMDDAPRSATDRIAADLLAWLPPGASIAEGP
jgi:hypothetical protein